jgi:hypothetical protein
MAARLAILADLLSKDGEYENFMPGLLESSRGIFGGL